MIGTSTVQVDRSILPAGTGPAPPECALTAEESVVYAMISAVAEARMDEGQREALLVQWAAQLGVELEFVGERRHI